MEFSLLCFLLTSFILIMISRENVNGDSGEKALDEQHHKKEQDMWDLEKRYNDKINKDLQNSSDQTDNHKCTKSGHDKMKKLHDNKKKAMDLCYQICKTPTVNLQAFKICSEFVIKGYIATASQIEGDAWACLYL